MVCSIKMYDKDTGELLGNTSCNYVFDLLTPKDRGFAYLRRWLESCVRGCRLTDHKHIGVEFSFDETKPLPLAFAPDDVKHANFY